jgi:isocitrate/isopropylmalate dehydrogenase
MMLEHTGLPEAAHAIEAAVIECLEAKECTADVLGSLGARAAADAVVRRLKTAA